AHDHHPRRDHSIRTHAGASGRKKLDPEAQAKLALLPRPVEALVGESWGSLDQPLPRTERCGDDPVVDEVVDDPLDLRRLEREDDLAGRQIGAVSVEADFLSVAGWTLTQELGGSNVSSFLQPRNDHQAIHRLLLVRSTEGASRGQRRHPGGRGMRYGFPAGRRSKITSTLRCS